MEKDEETGLSYHHHRYYATWIARWTSSDPIGLAGGINRFAFVQGQPSGVADPTGLGGGDNNRSGRADPYAEEPFQPEIIIPKPQRYSPRVGQPLYERWHEGSNWYRPQTYMTNAMGEPVFEVDVQSRYEMTLRETALPVMARRGPLNRQEASALIEYQNFLISLDPEGPMPMAPYEGSRSELQTEIAYLGGRISGRIDNTYDEWRYPAPWTGKDDPGFLRAAAEAREPVKFPAALRRFVPRYSEILEGRKTGHPEDHGFKMNDPILLDIRNKPDKIYVGTNSNKRQVVVFLKAGNVLITDASDTSAVITAYGEDAPRDPKSVPDKWWNDPNYTSVQPGSGK